MAKIERVLVTGGSGFIGSNLVRHLNAVSDVDVVVLDDFSTGIASNLDGLSAKVVQGSITDLETVHEAMGDCDAVVHLAALGSVPRSIADPVSTHEANVNGTLNVLRVARDRDVKVVFSSSSSVYGANPQLPKVETMTAMPMSPYAVSKLSSEQYVRAYGLCYGMDVLPFRFFNVFGPGQRADHQYAAAIPLFVDALVNGRAPIVHGDGTQSRDFTYVGDVSAVLAKCLFDGISSTDPVNLAFGGRYSLLEVLSMLNAELGVSIEPEFVDPRPGDVAHSQADSGLLRSLFSDIEPTPILAGLQTTVQWFQSEVGRVL
jgi:UDP-glucose 4-epimerase